MKHVIILLLTMQLAAFSKPDQTTKEANEKRENISAELAVLTVEASNVGKSGGDDEANARVSDSMSKKLKLGEDDQAKLRPIVMNALNEMQVGFLTSCCTKAFSSSTFSTKELSGIREFYQSDAGKAFLAHQSDRTPLSPEEESGVREFIKSDVGKAFLTKREEFGIAFEEIRKASTKDLHQQIMERIRKEAPELFEKEEAEQDAEMATPGKPSD